MQRNQDKNISELTDSEIQKIISETVRSLSESDFDKEAEKAKKEWGGETEPEEEFDAEEFFGDAGDAAEEDIKADPELGGEEEFAPFGTMEDPRMLKDLEEDEEIGQPGLFRPQDSEGNDIRLKSLVKLAGSEKKGRVLGFGDDGAGNMVVRVDWQFPTDMKFMEPKEMGEKREKPEDLIVQGLNEMDANYGGDKLRAVKVTYGDGSEISTSMAAHLTDKEIYDYFEIGKEFNIGSVSDNVQPVASVDIIKENEKTNTMNEEKKCKECDGEVKGVKSGDEIIDVCDECGAKESGVEEETIDEMRGLGKGVRNSGDRNVKMRDDNHSAPLTNINESVNDSIKTLMEGSVTKKILKKFISEEAKKVAKNLKG